MTRISTFLHGFLDYLTAALMIALPFLLDWHGGVRYLMVGLGVATILYSLFTDYELSVSRKLSFNKHLALDAVQGLLLIAAPFLLLSGETTAQGVFLAALGAFEIAVVSVTVKHPELQRTPAYR
jgi:hypothetical protein